MRIAITGGTGMIGQALAEKLRARGDEVLILTRKVPKTEEQVQWDATRGCYTPARLDGIDALFNLAGAPIADRPWTKARREVLRESRIDITQALFRSMQDNKEQPKVVIGSGGLGYFGDRGEEVLDESSGPGEGFLAELARDWEAATLSAEEQLGSRAAVVRMNLVLSPTGGAFPLMVGPFKWGIGGWLGPGKQYTSWVSIRDVVGSFLFLLDHPELSGPFHATVPKPIPNKEWCKALGRVLHRPVLTHAPKWALKGALGELADDIFLASIRAVPKRLTEAGYTFVDTDIEATFAWLVKEHAELKRRR